MKNLLSAIIIIVSTYQCYAQEFKCSIILNGAKNAPITTRNRWKVAIDDSLNYRIIETEAMFKRVYPCHSDFIPVEIPLFLFDSQKQYAGESHIFACLDKQLKIRFVFPLGTADIGLPNSDYSGYFIYTTRPSSSDQHWWNTGLIDTTGKVILEPKYDRVMVDSVGNVMGMISEYNDGINKDKLRYLSINDPVDASFVISIPDDNRISFLIYAIEMGEEVDFDSQVQELFCRGVMALRSFRFNESMLFFKKVRQIKDNGRLGRIANNNIKSIRLFMKSANL